MICTCGKSGKAGYSRLNDSDLWVCGNCMLPSRMVFDKLTLRYSPARATMIRSVVDDSDGRSIITWGTTTSGEKIRTMVFRPYPRKIDMTPGRNVCVALWEKLDNAIDIIREPGNPGSSRRREEGSGHHPGRGYRADHEPLLFRLAGCACWSP